MNDCIFCKIINRQIPATVISENDNIIVIKDISPKATIHYLIIPKKHIKDIQSLEQNDFIIGAQMFQMAQELSQKQVDAKDFRTIINSGAGAGQIVFHLHMHFLAGSSLPNF